MSIILKASLLLTLANVAVVLGFFNDKLLGEPLATLVFNISEILPESEGELISLPNRKFIINGTVYDTKHTSQYVSNLPQMATDSEGKVLPLNETSPEIFIYDFYHGIDSEVAFTLITHVSEDGVVSKQMRGNIFDGDQQIVVEPHLDDLSASGSSKRRKRQTGGQVLPPRVQVQCQKRMRRQDVFDANSRADRRAPSAANRDRRSVPTMAKTMPETNGRTDAYIKILGVVDFTLYQRALKSFEKHGVHLVGTYLEAYMCQIINIANLYYTRSLKNNPSLSITLVPQSFIILTTEEASSFTTSINVLTTVNDLAQDNVNRVYVDGDACIHEFNRWLVNYKYAHEIKTPHDVAIAFVGANLFSVGDLLGIANSNSVCKSGSSGVVVEDIEGFFSAQTIAHEIGHALGLPHDGDLKNSKCPDTANNVMSSSLKSYNLINSFYFSPCSVDLLVANIKTNNKFPCLLEKATPDADVVRFSNYAPGQLSNLTEQCRIVFGPGNFPLMGEKGVVNGQMTKFEDDICTNFWCTPDGLSGMSKQPAAEKTSCGDGKWCQDGKCASHPDAPRGDCLIEDDTEKCEKMTNERRYSYVCSNFNTGICCKYCNPSARVIKPTHSYKVWLAENKINNLKFLDKYPKMKCEDDLWCELHLSNYIATVNKDACTSRQAYIGPKQIRNMCKTICGTCK